MKELFFTGVLFISALCVQAMVFRIRLKRKEHDAGKLIRQQELLSRAVIEVEEKERSRIAYELNESIGQQISAAKLNVSALQAFLQSTNDVNRKIFQNTVDLLDDSVKEVRTISQSMIPHSLVKGGFVLAVREFVTSVGRLSEQKINLEVVGAIARLEPTKEAVLFRVFQEVVTNALKHAKATGIEIQLVKHETELSILVADNGLGFDLKKSLQSDKALGLKSIQSRVAFLDGKVFFDSCPTKGTTVTIELPM